MSHQSLCGALAKLADLYSLSFSDVSSSKLRQISKQYRSITLNYVTVSSDIITVPRATLSEHKHPPTK